MIGGEGVAKFVLETSDVHDVDEAAKLLGKGVATIWRWIRDNKITVLKISGRTFVPHSEIERIQKEVA